MTCATPSEKNMVLTGPLRAGKSALVRRLIRARGGPPPAGYYIEAESDQNHSAARLYIRDWPGESRCCFAERIAGHALVGRPPYRVNAPAFEKRTTELLQEARTASFCVVDELGVLESGLVPFAVALRKLLNSPARTLLVMQRRALHHWRENLGLHHAATWNLTRANRDHLLDELLHYLQETEHGGRPRP